LNIKAENSGYYKQDFIYEVGNYTRVVVEGKFCPPNETKIPLYRKSGVLFTPVNKLLLTYSNRYTNDKN
jgi:hypothetical protein